MTTMTNEQRVRKIIRNYKLGETFLWIYRIFLLIWTGYVVYALVQFQNLWFLLYLGFAALFMIWSFKAHETNKQIRNVQLETILYETWLDNHDQSE